MIWVYVLYSRKYSRQYVGMTEDLAKRLALHNDGKITSTKPYRPWEIIYSEELASKMAARNREKYLKSAAGRRWRKHHLQSVMGD